MAFIRPRAATPQHREQKHRRQPSTARLTGVIAGRHCQIGRNVAIGPGTILGDKSVLTDYSRVEATSVDRHL